MGLPCVSTPAYGSVIWPVQSNLGLHVLQRSPNCLGAPDLFKAPQLHPKYIASTHHYTTYVGLLSGKLP
jgi:hypothetical protein